jgi:hypothetical protein
VQSILGWFAGLPVAVLYPALTILAALENVFPPLPTDTVVALGTWGGGPGGGGAGGGGGGEGGRGGG